MSDTRTLYCNRCERPAAWVRQMNGSGGRPFCAEHAKQESDFGQSKPACFCWKEILQPEAALKHRTEIEGYEGGLQLLAERIHDLRYDQVEKFYRHSAFTLQRRAKRDRLKGRMPLSALLEEAARTAKEQECRFKYISALCRVRLKEQS